MALGFSGLNLSIDDVATLFPRACQVRVSGGGTECIATARRELGRVLEITDDGTTPPGRAFVTVGTEAGAWRLDGTLHRDRRTGTAFITVHRGARFNRRSQSRLEPGTATVFARAVNEDARRTADPGNSGWSSIDVIDRSRSGLSYTGAAWAMWTRLEILGIDAATTVIGRVVRSKDDYSAVRFEHLVERPRN
jgi:hypothetical protein